MTPLPSADERLLTRTLNTLIVDDSEGMQRLLAEMLSGCVRGRIATARSLPKATATLNSEAFDLVLVDREMGEENGLAFIRHIRARADVNRHIPAIALSVHASRETLLEALMSGAHSMLRKPVSRRDLQTHVRRALTEPRVFVPLSGHVVPLARSLAGQLGERPDAATVIETLAGAVARTAPAQEFDDGGQPFTRPAPRAAADGFSLI